MFLTHLLGIPSLDLQYISELFDVIADDQLGCSVREELADLPLGQIDANTMVNTIFYGINQEVYYQIKEQLENDTIAVSSEAEREKLVSLCQERIEEFSPYLNACDSYFNNELDDVTVRGHNLNQIIDDVIPLLLENARN